MSLELLDVYELALVRLARLSARRGESSVDLAQHVRAIAQDALGEAHALADE